MEGRRKHFQLRTQKNRPAQVDADPRFSVVRTYTVDYTYVAPLQLTDLTWRQIVPIGTTMAYNPANGKVVPNYATYGFGVVGVLTSGDVDCAEEGEPGEGDRVCSVIHRGIVFQDRVWDNGTYNGLTQATRDALIERIDFTNSTQSTRPKYGGGWKEWNTM